MPGYDPYFTPLGKDSNVVSSPPAVRPSVVGSSVSGAPKQPADELSGDPYFTPANHDATPPAAATADKSMSKPSEATSDPYFTPANHVQDFDATIRPIWEAQQRREANRTPGEAVSDYGQQAVAAVKGMATPFTKIPEELASDPNGATVAGAGKKILATGLEAGTKGSFGLADMAGKVINSIFSPVAQALGTVVTNPTGDPSKGTLMQPPPTPEEQYQKFKLDYLQQHPELTAGPGYQQPPTTSFPFSEAAQKAGFTPYPNTAEAGATTLQFLAPMGDVSKLAGLGGDAGKLASLARTPEAAAAAATQPAAVKALGTVANLGSEASGKLAEAGEKIASVEAKIPHPVKLMVAAAGAEKALGAIGAVKVLEKAGKVQEVFDFMKKFTQSDPSSPMGRLFEIASDPSSPKWIRAVAASTAAKTAAKGAQVAGNTAKGALEGAAAGGFYGVATGDTDDDMANDIGIGAAFGGTAGLTHAHSAAQADMLRRNFGSAERFYQAQVDSGVTPEELKNVDDSTLITAAVMQKLLPDHPIIFASERPDGTGPLPQSTYGKAGEFTGGKVFINLSAARDKGASLMHEVFHPIFKNLLDQQPQVKDMITHTLSDSGQTIQDVKNTYASQLFSDPEQAKQFIAAQDASSLKDSGDPDSWAHEEFLNEAAVQAMYGKHPILDALNPSLKSIIGDKIQQITSAFGKSPGKLQAATVLPGFDQSLLSPKVRQMVYGLLRAQKEAAVKGGSEQKGIPVSPVKDAGSPMMPTYEIGKDKAGNPIKGNDFGQMTTDSAGKQIFVQYPAKIVKQKLQSRMALFKRLFPRDKVTDSGSNSGPVQYRKILGGRQEVRGTQLPEELLKSNIEPEQVRRMNLLQDSLNGGKMVRYWYNKAVGAKGEYTGNVESSPEQGTPVSFWVSKQNQLMSDMVTDRAWSDKANRWAQEHGPASLDLWNGDKAAFLKDWNQVNANHAAGLTGDANGVGERKLNVINAFTYGANQTFKELNPLRAVLKGEDRHGIFKSHRVDRMESMDTSEGGALTQPAYEKGVKNLSPEVQQPGSDIEIEGPDGVKYPARFDGYQDMRIIGKGMMPQVTVKEGAPGFGKGTTTYAPYLEKKGFKVPKLAEFSGEQKNVSPDEVGNKIVEDEVQRRAAMSSTDFPSRFSPDVKEGLDQTVGKEMKLIHFSSNGELSSIDPAKFGKGKANRNDLRGGPKSYWFVEGSPMSGDSDIFGKGGSHAYGATVDGKKIYDLSVDKDDPQGYFSNVNRWEADDALKKAGYDGVYVETTDGRHVVMMFKPQKAKLIGSDFKGSRARIKGASYSPDVEEKQGQTKGDNEVRKNAMEYMKSTGRPYEPGATYHPVDPEFSKSVGDFYHSAAHNPSDPAVQAAYKAFGDETKAQWDFITSKGVKMEPWTKEGQPYKSSADMMKDVKDNKHLYFFPTEKGFGTSEVADHPLLADTGVKVGKMSLSLNDMFRAVHDYFGHSKEGYEFGPRGEYNAYLAHSKMYSDAAKPAMAAETLGQNSWVNFGPHLRDENGNIPAKGQPGHVSPMDRPFAEQKATVLPESMVKNQPKELIGGMFSPDVVDTSKEHITTAALEMPDGKTFEGPVHMMAAMWAEAAGYNLFDQGIREGFMTSKGRFVDRLEAKKLAMHAGQIDARKALAFDRQFGEGTVGKTLSGQTPLEAIAFTHTKAFSPDVAAKLAKIPGAHADEIPDHSGDYWMTRDGKFLSVTDHQQLVDQVGAKDVYELYKGGLVRTVVRVSGDNKEVWLTGAQNPVSLSPKQKQASVTLEDRGFAVNHGDFVSEYLKGRAFSPDVGQGAISQRGKTLEKLGYSITRNKIDDMVSEIVAKNKEGRTVSELKYWYPTKDLAQIQEVQTDPEFQKKGIGTALYSELGKILQEKGIKRLGGEVLSQVPVNIRKKVFGTSMKFSDDLEPMNEATARARLPENPPGDMNSSGPRLWAENKVSATKKFSPDVVEKAFKEAKDHFGVTKDLSEAGYVLPDGTMLDFSGRHVSKNAPAGRRSVEHREVAKLPSLGDSSYHGDHQTGVPSAMDSFLQMGAMRISPDGGQIQLMKKPSSSQLNVIKNLGKISQRIESSVFVDLHDGERKASLQGSPEKIVGRIRRFYNGEDLPEHSLLFSPDVKSAKPELSEKQLKFIANQMAKTLRHPVSIIDVRAYIQHLNAQAARTNE